MGHSSKCMWNHARHHLLPAVLCICLAVAVTGCDEVEDAAADLWRFSDLN